MVSASTDGLVIYAGFPKTGSQWILRTVWRGEGSGFSCVGYGREIARDFIENNEFEFDSLQTSNRYESRIREAVTAGLIPVIHHEGIACSLFGVAPPSKKPFAQIRAVFPGAKMILVVREQRQMLLSWYAHNVKLGLGAPLGAFLDEMEPGVTPYFRFDQFKFDVVTRFLYQLFGRDKVLVLPYEMLKADPNAYLQRIVEFCGDTRIPVAPTDRHVNVGLDAIQIPLMAWLNRRFLTDRPLPRPKRKVHMMAARMLRSFGELAPNEFERRVRSSMENVIDSSVGARYAQSNAELQRLVGIDLGRFGYKMP